MSLTALVLLAASVGAAADDVPAVTGTVVDEKDQPVAGAKVYLFDGPPIGRTALFGVGSKTRQPPTLFAHVQTDEKGEFEVALPVELSPPHGRGTNWLALAVYKPGLAVKTRLIERYWPARAAPIRVVLGPPRDNRVRIISPSGQPVAHARVWADQVDGVPLPTELIGRLATETDQSGEAELPDVRGEELRTVRVDCTPFGAQWAALARSSDGEANPVILSPVGAIRGQLVDAAGSPIALTRVRLAARIEPYDDLAGGGVAEHTTDADGRFNVPAVAAGVLQVSAELPPESPLVTTYQGTQQMGADMTNDVTIRYKRGVRVRGTVIDETSRHPVAGVVVSLYSAPDSPFAESNDAGEYSGYMLPGRSVYLTVVSLPRDYYKPSAFMPMETVPNSANEVVFKPLLVAAGTTLPGRVVDAAGRPVADAEVIGACRWSDRVGDRLVFARSDRDGNFMLPAVTNHADIKVTVDSVAGITTNPVMGSAREPDPLTVAVDLKGAMSLSGHVVDGGGQPVPGATVRVFPIRFNELRRAVEEDFIAFGGTERLYTDPQGRFDTPKQLRPDRGYCVVVDAPGMTPVRTEPIEPAKWRTTDFGDIVLSPTPRLRTVAGQVVDESRQPVAGAVLRQSGDGPRPTQTISDTAGRFQLGGIYEGPAWLLASHDGYRLQAEPIGDDARDVVIVLRNVRVAQGDDAAPPSSVATSDEATVCRALFAEHRGRLERESPVGPRWTAFVEYLLEGNLSDRRGTDVAYALGQGGLSHEQATELAQATDDVQQRCLLHLAAFDALGNTPDDQRDALAEALLAARAVDESALRVPLLGRIGERFFDLGDRQVGAAIVREAREKLAAILPDDTQPNLDVSRGALAPALAYLDLPAAYALIEKLRSPQHDWFLADVSRSLAAENPAEAEKALGQMQTSSERSIYGAGTVHRMATVDPERAARIARSFPKVANQAYSLGLVAEAQASARPELASKLVEDAYGLLERSQTEGSADVQYSTCGTAAALLVIVERAVPAMFEHYLARALAMRPPRPARGDPGARYEREIAEMALAIVPYDRKTARALLEPLAPRIRTLSAGGDRYVSYRQIWTAFALVDPAWARQLVDSLPDAPPEATVSPRATAAKHVIDALAHRGPSRWPWVYERFLHARHPDTPIRTR